MRFSVDTTSAMPVYAQLVAQVKEAIAAGVLRPGESLPSLRELAGQLRVNPLTVARAYRALEAGGIIVTEHGRGSCVSPRAAAERAAFRREALEAAVNRLLAEAAQMGASPDEVWAVLAARMRASAEPAPAPGE
ncbi:MAG TPA: GntR family transcriptional regulator [Armatimonadota bacterium]|nr:GntR family transcriptional regulator [Armatimonadota bacterium]